MLLMHKVPSSDCLPASSRPPSFLPAELFAWFLELQVRWNGLKVGWDLGLLGPEITFHIKVAKLLHCTLHYIAFCPQTKVRLFCKIWLVQIPTLPIGSAVPVIQAVRGHQPPPPTCRSPKLVITYDKVHEAMPLSRLRLRLYTASHRGSVKCANIYSPPLGSISATAQGEEGTRKY